jgi:NADH-quinone oxidoreductase subunit H
MLTFAVFAWAPDLVYVDLNVGVLYLLSISSITSLAIFVAGWASNNKYALLGAMRVIAMAISYEIPIVLALLGPVLFAGSMSLPAIIDFQRHYDVWLAFLLPLPLLIYAISATAELNRTPADIAEAESEIVAGFHTEYSGMKFGLFYAVELINSLAVSGIIASLFFGGYSLYGVDEYVPPWIIFIGKIYFFYFGLIWLRGTWPRLRIDQLMAFAWKLLIPLALINIVIVATEVLLWRELELDDWVLGAYALINIGTAALLLGYFFRMITRDYYRLPRRVRLVHDVSVPSLPAPGPAASS